MFRRSESAATPILFDFDGREIAARPGDSVAAALLAAGIRRFRDTAVSQSPRGPFCMMGVCFDCLVTIDGVPDRQACLTEAAPGMRVASQSGVPAIAGGRA